MLRLLADENFNGDIVPQVCCCVKGISIFCACKMLDLGGADDPDILAWAGEHRRIVLTHDRATMPEYAYQRVAAGKVMPGVFIVNDRFPVGSAIQEILLIVACTDQTEWIGRVAYLPL